MYSYDADIRYSQCDCDGKLRVWNVANMFQDCSMKHSESLNVGMKELDRQQRAWILTRWQIVIDRLPKVGQNVVVGTWPTEFNKFLGTRNFVMKDEDGNVIAWADSLWAFVDTQIMKPVKAVGELVDAYTVEPPIDREFNSSKIIVKDMLQCADGEFVVGRRYIDTNNHMNNAQYIYKAMEYIPEKLEIAQIRVDYKMAIKYGQKVSVNTYSDGDKKYIVAFNDENGKPYSLLEFTGRE